MANRVSVRLNKTRTEKLGYLYEFFNVKGDSDSNKLRNLIDLCHEYVIKREKLPQSQSQQTDEYPQCFYHAVTDKGEWYCDLKKIPKEVCLKRQQRYISQDRRCYPSTKSKRRRARPRSDNSTDDAPPVFTSGAASYRQPSSKRGRNAPKLCQKCVDYVLNACQGQHLQGDKCQYYKQAYVRCPDGRGVINVTSDCGTCANHKCQHHPLNQSIYKNRM